VGSQNSWPYKPGLSQAFLLDSCWEFHIVKNHIFWIIRGVDEFFFSFLVLLMLIGILLHVWGYRSRWEQTRKENYDYKERSSQERGVFKGWMKVLHRMVKEEFESIRATVLDQLLSMPERMEDFYYLNVYGDFPVLESFVDFIRSLHGGRPLAIPVRLQVWSRSVESPLINSSHKNGRFDREMRAKSYYYRAVVLPAMIKEAQTYRAPATNFFRQYEEERLHEWERLKALESQCMYTDEEVFNDYDESDRSLDDDDDDYKMSICSDRDAETYGEEYSGSLDDRDSFSSAMGHIFSKGFERREEKSSDEDQDDPEALNDYDDANRFPVDESDCEMSICSDRDESGDGDDDAMRICSDRDDTGDQDDADDDDDEDSFSAAMERLFAKGFARREEKPRSEHIPPPTLVRDYKPEAEERSAEEQHQLFENFGGKIWHSFKSHVIYVISSCRLIRDTILNLHRIVRATSWKNPSLKSFINFIRCDIFRGEPLSSAVRPQEHLACNSTQDWMADYKNFYGANTDEEEFHDYDESNRFVDADSEDRMSICSDRDQSGDLEDAGEEDSGSFDDRDSFSVAMDQIFSKLLARREEKSSDGDDAMSICSR